MHDPTPEPSPFAARASADGKVLITWHGRLVTVLKGARARALLARLEGADATARHLLLARATGNFKRGNERRGPR